MGQEKSSPLPLDSNRQRFFSSGGKISDLPATRKEINTIELLAKRNTANQIHAYLDHQATEESLKQLRDVDILHIATHGFFFDKEELHSMQNSSWLSQSNTNNPLLRSGILLAGAELSIKGENVEGEDGILTAEEAINLDLAGTDLVVLSACETALGEISAGEGVYGLQRAFQQAGAATVVMSLWTVSDQATQEFMTFFYTALLQEKLDKKAAFRKAQLQLKAIYADPYYWAAFVMIGE